MGRTYVALKSTAVVDGEKEDDVASGVVGFGEDVEVLLLRCPTRHLVVSIASRRMGEEE